MQIIKQACKKCGAEFDALQKEVRRGSGKFCSRTCANSRPRTDPKRTNVSCAQCRVHIWVKPSRMAKATRSFCSRTCKDGFFSKVKRCAVCQRFVTNNRSTFCSNKCHVQHRRQCFIASWLRGDVSGTSGAGRSMRVAAIIRHHLLDAAGHKCSRCGWSEMNPISGKVPLTIDHVDGNASNSSPENLVVLCPSCHSLTPTYGALNRGFGRDSQVCK